MAVLHAVWGAWPFCDFLCVLFGAAPVLGGCRPCPVGRTVRQIDTATAVNVVSGSCGLVKRALTR